MDDFALRVKNAPLGETHLFSLGQAGYVVKSANGQLLGIDLYLSDCVERIEGHSGFKRLQPKILDPLDLQFDVVIATHPHFDHFDFDAIPKLLSNMHTLLFASIGCKRQIKLLGIPDDNCTFVKPGDCCECGDFCIDFVDCDHGPSAPDAVGVVIQVDGKKIYEAGDTCLRLDKMDDLRSKGPFDVMIAPINGANGNLNEQECSELAKALHPKLTIPCHYGMFASHGGDSALFQTTLSKTNCAYLLMTIGDRYTFKDTMKREKWEKSL